MNQEKIIPPHPLQSPAWGEFRTRMGIHTATQDDWLVTFHRIPHTPWTIGYFPKGPMPTKTMVSQLQQLGRQKNAVFIQLEPNIPASQKTKISQLDGIKPSHHPLFTQFTFVLDLTKSEEDLLKAMHPKTRYNIRVAQKHGVQIKEDNSSAAFNAYLRLSEETTSRQGFYAHSRTYHETMWEVLRGAGIAHLFTASFKGEIIAAWIIFVWENTAYYPYGTSSRAYREVMAPHLLLWEIAKWAKKRNLKRFDLWGAMGPDPDPNDPWYGFHRFKEGFRPTLLEFAGSYDLVLKPMLYQCYILADKIRWTILKHFKK